MRSQSTRIGLEAAKQIELGGAGNERGECGDNMVVRRLSMAGALSNDDECAHSGAVVQVDDVGILDIRMQPDETACPIVFGSFVPWIR